MNTTLGTIICEYRTMFENVSRVVPNIRPDDDVMYSSMNYEKCMNDMCQFLEGYVQYCIEPSEKQYDQKNVIASTKKFYDNMFADTSAESMYRHQTTLADMKNLNVTFLEYTRKLDDVLHFVMEQCDSAEADQLVTMSCNQFKKLAHVYNDDMKLYMWLSTRNSKTHPNVIPIKNKVDFRNTKTPVMHRMDMY